MSRIPSFVWIVVVVVLGVGFLAFLNSQKNADISAENQTLPVKAEVYVDYNCPHCAEFEPFVQEAIDKYGDKADIQTKNLPFLAETSTTYAYAAEAARLQNRFDDYSHDLFRWASYIRDPNNVLFEYSDEDKIFFAQPIDTIALAERLGLDINQFESDSNSQEVQDTVKQQKANIVKVLGTQSTPSVLIYGKPFTMTNFEDFGNKIGELINQIENSNNQQ